MKYCLSLLKLSCIFLIISTCAGQSTMLKEDFSQQGVSLVLPSDSTYGSELEKFGLSAIAGAGSFSVLVKNTSRRSVVGLGIRFTKRSSDGHIATADVMGIRPSALLDLGQAGRYDRPPEGLIMPGTARLVTPDGIVGASRNSYTSYRTATPWTIIRVQLDSAVFDDGQAIGPDQLDMVRRLKAHVDAQQNLTEEISERVSHGELLHNVLQELQRTVSSKTETGALTQADPAQVYSSVRQQYLDELTATQAKAGDDAAARRLRQLKYATRPNIHREKGAD